MKLTREEIRELQEAILGGYDEPTLKMMVRLELGENLTEIAGGESLTLRVRVFNLVEWAERNDRVEDLIQGAHAQVPSNSALQALAQKRRGFRPVARQPIQADVSAQPSIDSDTSHYALINRSRTLLALLDEELRKILDHDQLTESVPQEMGTNVLDIMPENRNVLALSDLLGINAPSIF